jgi:hypothetical protein
VSRNPWRRRPAGVTRCAIPVEGSLVYCVGMDHVAIVTTLDGVTTVLVAFLFVCLIFPSIVKNRPQFYAALAMIIFILLLHTMALMIKTDGILVAAGVFTGLLQIVALLLLVLCVGGLTARQLAGDMARAYEVMRRGETEKEVIIPIGPQGARRGPRDPPPSTVYHIDTGEAPQSSGSHDPDKPDESIPMT